MSSTANASLPVGFAVPDWQPRPQPVGVVLTGRSCRLEPLDPALHTDALFAAYSQAADDRDWLYMPAGPFPHAAGFSEYVEQLSRQNDPLHFAVIDLGSGQASGTLSLMRHQPQQGVVEVGFVTFAPGLQRSVLSTEAQFLLMKHVFDDLGYRRYEWKCDSLNQRSCNTAKRLGFSYEGTFRQAMVYKGRNRDTAWFAIIDKDWPLIKAAFEKWLHPDNFDTGGQQLRRLQAIREQIAVPASS